MYMNSVKELKTEVENEIKKSLNSKSCPEIFGIQILSTQWANIKHIGVQFKDEKGGAIGMVQITDDGYKLLAPLAVDLKEEKKK